MSTLRLLSVLLFLLLTTLINSSSSFAQAVPIYGDAARTLTLDYHADGSPHVDTSFDRMALDSTASADRTCLKIRAYIFETDDDKVPRLVRETTCLPTTRVHAQQANDSAQQPTLQLLGK